MWNPIENYRLKRDWRLVSTLKAYYTYSKQEKETNFYYLYENGLGNRKCKHESDGRYSGGLQYCITEREKHPYYLGTIRPWLEGQYNPEIPNYESIKAKEFKDALTGKIT